MGLWGGEVGGRWGEKPSPTQAVALGKKTLTREEPVKKWNEHPREENSPHKTLRKERKASDVAWGEGGAGMTSAPPGMIDSPW